MDRQKRRRVVIRLARKLVGVIAPRLRPEERWEAFQVFSTLIEQDLARFEAQLSKDPPEPSPN